MSDGSIKEAVRKLAGTHLKDDMHMIDAEVMAVDQASRTCTCTPIGGKSVTDLVNVQLMGEVEDGWLLIPVVGSTVRVAWSTRNVPHIAMFSAIQKAYLVTLESIQFHGGELGGLVIGPALLEKINILENTVNELNAKLDALSPTPVIPVIIETTIDEISNDSITHGE